MFCDAQHNVVKISPVHRALCHTPVAHDHEDGTAAPIDLIGMQGDNMGRSSIQRRRGQAIIQHRFPINQSGTLCVCYALPVAAACDCKGLCLINPIHISEALPV